MREMAWKGKAVLFVSCFVLNSFDDSETHYTVTNKINP